MGNDSILTLLRDPGPETIERFLAAWYGPARLAAQPIPPGAAPLAVRELAALVARWPRSFRCNHLEVEGPRLGDRHRLFYREAQSVFEWAVEADGSAVLVWGREAPDGEWLREREPLPRFLVQAMLVEAVMDIGWGDEGSWERPAGYLASRFVADPAARFIAGASAVGITEPQADEMLAGQTAIPYEAWRWPTDPTVFYAGDDALGLRNRRPDGTCDVFVAARRSAAIAHVARFAELEGLLLEPDAETDLDTSEMELRRIQAEVWRRRGLMRRLPQDPFSQSMRRSLGRPSSEARPERPTRSPERHD